MANLDPQNVLGSTGMLADQCEDIWQVSKAVGFPEAYKDLQNITLCGMGGSRYGLYVVESLYKDTLKIPFSGYGNYHVPAYLNEKSLFIGCSYSGGTEEVISSTGEAIGKRAMITGLTSGGKLVDLAKENNFPAITFDHKYNPSREPRLGTGYMIVGIISLLTRLGYLEVADEEIGQAIDELRQNQEKIQAKAKELAGKVKGYIPVVIGAEFLSGNSHIIRNQFNETSKSFAAFSELPELNHHLMEGLKNPEDKKLLFLFISSDLYSDKLQKRVELTKDVVDKNKVLLEEYKAEGSNKLSQCLNVLSFGGYISLYLAFLYGQDPGVVPWVNYFKKQLGGF